MDGRKITEDKVGLHSYLVAEFPYVGQAHKSFVTKVPKKRTTRQKSNGDHKEPKK
jgi:hypothetical protein